MGDLGQIPPQRRGGHESFHDDGRALGFDLLGFWRWSTSDVVNNTTRGVLAEYLVAQAVGAAHGVRVGWAAYDIDDPRGITIEVKSGGLHPELVAAPPLAGHVQLREDLPRGSRDSEARHHQVQTGSGVHLRAPIRTRRHLTRSTCHSGSSTWSLRPRSTPASAVSTRSH